MYEGIRHGVYDNNTRKVLPTGTVVYKMYTICEKRITWINKEPHSLDMVVYVYHKLSKNWEKHRYNVSSINSHNTIDYEILYKQGHYRIAHINCVSCREHPNLALLELNNTNL